MIHLGKPKPPANEYVHQAAQTPLDAGLERLDVYQKEAGKWIERNPLLSIGIALAIGLGVGWMFKRSR